MNPLNVVDISCLSQSNQVHAVSQRTKGKAELWGAFSLGCYTSVYSEFLLLFQAKILRCCLAVVT